METTTIVKKIERKIFKTTKAVRDTPKNNGRLGKKESKVNQRLSSAKKKRLAMEKKMQNERKKKYEEKAQRSQMRNQQQKSTSSSFRSSSSSKSTETSQKLAGGFLKKSSSVEIVKKTVKQKKKFGSKSKKMKIVFVFLKGNFSKKKTLKKKQWSKHLWFKKCYRLTKLWTYFPEKNHINSTQLDDFCALRIDTRFFCYLRIFLSPPPPQKKVDAFFVKKPYFSRPKLFGREK